jgi:hypothetical protein
MKSLDVDGMKSPSVKSVRSVVFIKSQPIIGENNDADTIQDDLRLCAVIRTSSSCR